MTESKISSCILDAAIEVHKQLGPGLIESSYEYCLEYELKQHGVDVKRQVIRPLTYKDMNLDAGYRIDFLVGDKVIVKIKSADALTEIHTAQLLTCLKLTGFKLGLLINFNTVALIDGLTVVLKD